MPDRAIQNCEIGTRFRAAGRTFLGSEREVWEVVSLTQEIDGLDYATLINIHDRTRSKKLAVRALLDRHLYLPA
jgi:hypothetical protein